MCFLTQDRINSYTRKDNLTKYQVNQSYHWRKDSEKEKLLPNKSGEEIRKEKMFGWSY